MQKYFNHIFSWYSPYDLIQITDSVFDNWSPSLQTKPLRNPSRWFRTQWIRETTPPTRQAGSLIWPARFTARFTYLTSKVHLFEIMHTPLDSCWPPRFTSSPISVVAAVTCLNLHSEAETFYVSLFKASQPTPMKWKFCVLNSFINRWIGKCITFKLAGMQISCKFLFKRK